MLGYKSLGILKLNSFSALMLWAGLQEEQPNGKKSYFNISQKFTFGCQQKLRKVGWLYKSEKYYLIVVYTAYVQRPLNKWRKFGPASYVGVMWTLLMAVNSSCDQFSEFRVALPQILPKNWLVRHKLKEVEIVLSNVNVPEYFCMVVTAATFY